ncbi:MAG: IclR family transcriptional regulator [Rhodobacter sp.]|nr:IclR family transcriptional regulator [Rhodobacter sp.]
MALQSRPRGRPKAFHDKTEQNTIQSLDRAMSVLQVLSANEGLTLTQLADLTDQSAATLYRVLTTLAQHAIAEFDEVRQVWHVGSGAFSIGSAFLRRTSVVERARPVLRQLMQDTGETANLGVANGDRVLFVSQVETHSPIRAFFPPGTASAMHASGIGKALLAFLPADAVARYVRDCRFERFTEATITGADQLLADLARIRASGLSLDNEERAEGMRCLAAPVFNGFGEPVAGISVSGPVQRMDAATLASHGERVRAAAEAVTRGIGGTGPEGAGPEREV